MDHLSLSLASPFSLLTDYVWMATANQHHRRNHHQNLLHAHQPTACILSLHTVNCREFYSCLMSLVVGQSMVTDEKPLHLHSPTSALTK